MPDAIVIGTKGEHVWIVARSVYLHLPPRPATFVLVGCLFQQLCACLAGLFATTRFAWALARDSAVPFGDVLKKVGKAKVPTRAAIALTAFAAVLSAPIVATVSHGGMLVVSALFTSSLYFSVVRPPLLLRSNVSELIFGGQLTYMFPMVVYLTCPTDVLQLDGRNVWTLTNWSRPLSIVALVCLCFALGVMACPTASPIQLGPSLPLPSLLPSLTDRERGGEENWSWSPVVTVGTIVLSTLSWIVYGNAHYAGPIRSITVWTTGHEVGLPSASGSSKKGSRKTGSLNGHPLAAAAGGGGGGGGVKEKTTSLAKGETAAVFEGSMPTDWDEGTGVEETDWDEETGATTGWDEETGAPVEEATGDGRR